MNAQKREPSPIIEVKKSIQNNVSLYRKSQFQTFGFSSFKSRKRMYTFTKKMFDTIICVFRSKRVKKKVAINGIKAFATQEKAKD